MGKIFGISNLKASTIGDALKPTQELVQKAPSKVLKDGNNQKLTRTPLKDVFVRRPKNPSTMSK